MIGRRTKAAAPSYVAIACWLDLLGYGGAIDKAGFDPAHPLAQPPLRRLRAFHRIVAKHSSAGFPTLVMNDGAVGYSNVELLRSDKVWRFVERCWALYEEATTTDLASGGPGLRGVIAVGLRAKGSNRGITAQDRELTAIIEDFAAGRIDKQKALADTRKVRRVFDIIPQLQANFAFTRAYEAEQAGSAAGFRGPNLFLDTTVFAGGVPDWISAGDPIAWAPKKASLATSFVAVRGIDSVQVETARAALRTGHQLLDLLSYHSQQ